MSMKCIKLIILLVFVPAFICAQDGESVYNFLRFPTSSRVNALGGHSVSLVELDPSLAFHNPALLGGEMDGMVNINYMNYISDVNIGSMVYTKAFRERSSWGVGAIYMNYGNMEERDMDVLLGTFSAQDIGIHAFYSYDLSDKWRGGLSLKGLYSTIADYSSFGIAVDAGLSYFDVDNDFSFGFALKNIGAQLKSYYDERQNMPWDIQMGITKRMAHAPIRLSVNAMYLNKWKIDYTDNLSVEADSKESFLETAMKHLVFGVEFIPTDNLWLGIGLNPKTKMDMKLLSGNGLGGFSIGGGIKVSRFNVGASFSRYHPSATSLMLSVTMSLSEINL